MVEFFTKEAIFEIPFWGSLLIFSGAMVFLYILVITLQDNADIIKEYQKLQNSLNNANKKVKEADERALRVAGSYAEALSSALQHQNQLVQYLKVNISPDGYRYNDPLLVITHYHQTDISKEVMSALQGLDARYYILARMCSDNKSFEEVFIKVLRAATDHATQLLSESGYSPDADFVDRSKELSAKDDNIQIIE